MDGNMRRDQILFVISSANTSISANTLAKKFGVSRQVIVGDIALLRALGNDIIADSKGYSLNKNTSLKSYQVVVKHKLEDTRDELTLLIKSNVIVLDVTVNHATYGILKGELNIRTLEDIEIFMNRKPNLLSALTDGLHIHTLLYANDEDLQSALSGLEKKGFIYND